MLAFFASTNVVTVPGRRRSTSCCPGSLALAIVAAGLVNLGIATAYERSYGVLKRLGGSPLGRDGLVVAKTGAVGVIVVLQMVLLFLRGGGPGLAPGRRHIAHLLVVVVAALGTVTFCGLGLLLAGTLRAEATLALANGLFVAALLVGGIIVPTSSLPGTVGVRRRPAAGRGTRGGLPRRPGQ